MRIDPNPSREHPHCAALTEQDLLSDPIELFVKWHENAKNCSEIIDSNAMCLSTLAPDGFPEGRIVLLREIDGGDFIFYTNTESAKGAALKHLSRAALTFYWDPLRRQIRIQGEVRAISSEEADSYFSTRPRKSQIGAWASSQSRPLSSRDALEKRIEELTKDYDGREIPRPEYWSGYRVTPRSIEFWQERNNRLHDRFRYERENQSTDATWKVTRLYP